jgi:hypothetical protein
MTAANNLLEEQYSNGSRRYVKEQDGQLFSVRTEKLERSQQSRASP